MATIPRKVFIQVDTSEEQVCSCFFFRLTFKLIFSLLASFRFIYGKFIILFIRKTPKMPEKH